MFEFTVIDTTINQYPDLWKIATTEEWAKHLMYCDMEGFAISEDGKLLLLDECGGVAYCPADRFKVVYTADVAPRAEVEEIIYKLECLLCHATGSKLSKHTYDLRTMETVVTDYINESYDEGYRDAKSEVAREIFEEIEFDIHQLMFDRDETQAIAIEGIIANLKKKYTEGGG